MEFLKENEFQPTTNIRKNIIKHLKNLKKLLSKYFSDTYNDTDWIQNLFVNEIHLLCYPYSNMKTLLKYETCHP